MQVGYIGLGIMGAALAKRLAAERPLKVYDLDPSRVATLEAVGAKGVANASDMGPHCDVVFLCLPRSEHVQDVLFGQGGLAANLRPGANVVDQTSGDPTLTRQMAQALSEKGIGFVDAPVSGGAAGAEAGTIAIMAGGKVEAVEIVRPILEQISPNIFLCGDIGAGQVMKLVNNTISATNRCAMVEAVIMGMKNGLDLSVMTDVLNSGGARSVATEMMLPALVRGEPDAFFRLELMLKDLNLSAGLATKSGVPHEYGQLTRATLQAALNTQGQDANYFDVSDHLATQAGTDFKRR